MEKLHIVIITMCISQITGVSDEKKCQLETNVVPNDVKKYLQLKLPETKEGKINSQGKITSKRAGEIAQYYIESHDQLRRAENAIERCSQRANHMKDECETAYYFMKCLSALSSSALAKTGGTTFSITLPTLSIELPPVTFVLFQLSVL